MGLEVNCNQEPFPMKKKVLLFAAKSGREKDDEKTCTKEVTQAIEDALV